MALSAVVLKSFVNAEQRVWLVRSPFPSHAPTSEVSVGASSSRCLEAPPRPAPGPLHRDSLSRAARVVTPDSALQPVGCQASACPAPTRGCAALQSGGLSFLLPEGQSIPLRGASDLGVPLCGARGAAGYSGGSEPAGRRQGVQGTTVPPPFRFRSVPAPPPWSLRSVRPPAGACLPQVKTPHSPVLSQVLGSAGRGGPILG